MRERRSWLNSWKHCYATQAAVPAAAFPAPAVTQAMNAGGLTVIKGGRHLMSSPRMAVPPHFNTYRQSRPPAAALAAARVRFRTQTPIRSNSAEPASQLT